MRNHYEIYREGCTKMFKKLAIILCFSTLFLTACGSGGSNTKNAAANTTINQLTPPVKGDTIALMKTSMGDIKIKLFPQIAPKTVENFVKHSKDGYFNNLIFHRVINNFMIQGGDPLGTGTGGESIWGKPFEDEFSDSLHNFKGALSMANSGPNTNGSQFFIVQLGSADQGSLDYMKTNGFKQDVIDQYAKSGGTPWLDNRHTVFGQVYEGIEVVDKIAAVPTSGSPNDKPLEDVKILSVEISTQE